LENSLKLFLISFAALIYANAFVELQFWQKALHHNEPGLKFNFDGLKSESEAS
jgi:hypothetical protein